jgi:hypothetical protein
LRKPRRVHNGPWRSLQARTHHTPRPCRVASASASSAKFGVSNTCLSNISRASNNAIRERNLAAVRRLAPSRHLLTRPRGDWQVLPPNLFGSNGNLSRKVRTVEVRCPGPREGGIRVHPTRRRQRGLWSKCRGPWQATIRPRRDLPVRRKCPICCQFAANRQR